MTVRERLLSLKGEVIQELQEKLKSQLGVDSLESEELKLEIRLVSQDEFDVMIICPRCLYEELLATLPIGNPETWQRTIAIRLHSTRFFSHHCSPLSGMVRRPSV